MRTQPDGLALSADDVAPAWREYRKKCIFLPVFRGLDNDGVFDLCGRQQSSVQNATVASKGQGLAYPTTTSTGDEYLRFDEVEDYGFGDADTWSVLVCLNKTGVAGVGGGLLFHGVRNNAGLIQFGPSGTNTDFRIEWHTGGGFTSVVWTGGLPDGLHTWVAGKEASTAYRLFLDGANQGQKTNANVIAATSDKKFEIASSEGSSFQNRHTAGDYFVVAVLRDVPPTAALAKAFHENPWGLLEPGTMPPIAAFHTEAAGGETLTPGQADLALDGKAPTVTATDNHTVTPSQADLLLSTAVPTITVGGASQTATPAQADLVLSAAAPTITATDNHPIAVGQANLALDGKAPTATPTANHVIQIAKSDIVLDAKAPTAIAEVSYSFLTPQGNLVLSTFAPELLLSTAQTTEPRGSTRADQRHPAYDFGEHYPYLSREDKQHIDAIIDALRPKQKESLKRGKPSNAVRKKIAAVLPDYETYTPRPTEEYLADAEDNLDTLLTIILLTA